MSKLFSRICATVTISVLVSSTAAPVQAAPKSSFGNGKFTVGRQIQSGIYRATSVGARCYWEISTTGSNGNDIIANGNTAGGILTLNLSSGQDIENRGCGNFARSSLTGKRGTPRKTFGNGIWLVGVDVQPGNYTAVKSALGTHCYLAISTAGSNGADILANQNYTNGTPTMTLDIGEEIDNDGCGIFKQG